MKDKLAKDESLIPAERIERSILLIRGQKVILDRDLAYLYGVTTKVLNQGVKRHKDRFPEDFMFQLTKWGVWNDNYGLRLLNWDRVSGRQDADIEAQ